MLRSILPILIIVTLGIVVWALVDGGRDEQAVRGSLDKTDSEPREPRLEPPRLRAGTRSVNAEAPSEGPSSTAADQPPEWVALRLHGRVDGPDGVHKWHTPFVYVLGPEDGEGLLARTDVDEDGRFDVSVRFPNRHPRSLCVAARSPGARPVFRSLLVEPPSEVRVDFTFDAGEVITGRVVDDHGEPIPGLELLLNSSRVIGMVARVGAVLETMTPSKMLSAEAVGYHETRCVTDGGGYFRATGLAPGEYTPWTTSDEWFVRQNRRVKAGSDGIELTADPAVGFELRVTDANTHEPLAEFGGTALIRSAQQNVNMSLSGSNGSETYVWRELAEETRAGFDLDLRVTADGYDPAVRRVRFEPGTTPRMVSIELPPTPMGTAEVIVVDGAGERVDLDLVADLVSYPDESKRLRAVVLERTGEEGRYRIEGPAGSWMGSVRPSHEFGALLAVPVEVQLTIDARAETRVLLPPFGAVKLSREKGGEPMVAVTVVVRRLDSESATSMFLLEGAERDFPGVGEGEWEAEVIGGADSGVRRRFHVTRGETTVVRLGPK